MLNSLRSNVVAIAPTWGEQSYRACQICDHRSDCGKRCTHPHVAAGIETARSNHGACGPDAKYLSFPGLTLGSRR